MRATSPVLAPSRARAAWAMLGLRPVLALGGQALLALVLLVTGSDTPWRLAADAWLATFAVGEVLNLVVLQRLAANEGLSLRALASFGNRATRAGDVRWVALALAVSGPLAMLPNILLGTLLWGDPAVGAALCFRPIPVGVAVATLVVFPVVHALTELPTYFGYVMPRLRAELGRVGALLVCATVLSAQHVFLPLLLDPPYAVWRLFMFFPFALWMGFVIDRRPTTLPYLVVGHALLDLSLPWFILRASLAP